MSGKVLVGPSGRVESHCVAQTLRVAGLAATTDSSTSGLQAAVVLAVRGVTIDDILTVTLRRLRFILLISPEADWEVTAHVRREAVVSLPWGGSTERLLQAVRALAVGGSELTALRAALDQAHPFRQLTAREHEIVALLARGQQNGEIASALGISHHTVRTHIAHVFDKVGVSHRHALAVLAQRGGFSDTPARCTLTVGSPGEPG